MECITADKLSLALSAICMPFSASVEPSSIASTTRRVSAWMRLIISAILAVAEVVRSASLRTSSATTAKPRPCSPARAASMAAFSANKLVWSAISSITCTISPISWLDCPSFSTVPAESLTILATLRIPSKVERKTCSPSYANCEVCKAIWAASLAL